MAESELIEHSKRGDSECFNKLVESYQRLVYTLALRMRGDGQAAEDASQDAFLLAWRKIGGFRGGSFKAWLLRITANICRDQLRKMKRHPQVSLDAMAVAPGPSFPVSESAEDHARRLGLSEEIGNGLLTLPWEQRLAVILCDVWGMSYEEMAHIMKCSLGTVKSRLSRGRAQLRDYLREMGTFPS